MVTYSRGLFVSVCGLLVLFGCSRSPVARLHTLPPVMAEKVSIIAHEPIQTVTVPEYLDRKEFVSVAENGSLVMSNVDQWGEPLNEAIKRRLRVLLRGVPLKGAPYRIEIDACEYRPGENGVVFSGAIHDVNDVAQTFMIRKAVANGTAPLVAAATAEAVAELADVMRAS